MFLQLHLEAMQSLGKITLKTENKDQISTK